MNREAIRVVSIGLLVCFWAETGWAYEAPPPPPDPAQAQTPPPLPPPEPQAAPSYGEPPQAQQPSEEPSEPPVRTRRYARPVARPGRGLITAGIVILAIGYGISAVMGAIILAGAPLAYKGAEASKWQTVGGTMLIPVAGPWIGMAIEGQFDLLQVLLGVTEVLGAGLLIGGIAARASVAEAPHPAPRPLAFTVSPLPGGGFASVIGSF